MADKQRFQQFMVSDSDSDSSDDAVPQQQQPRVPSSTAGRSVKSTPRSNHENISNNNINNGSMDHHHSHVSSVASAHAPPSHRSHSSRGSAARAPPAVPARRGGDSAVNSFSEHPIYQSTPREAAPPPPDMSRRLVSAPSDQGSESLTEVSTVNENGERKRRKVVRKRVVRRKRVGDPNDPGEIVSVEEIRTPRDQSPQGPPPPVSRRAARAASSRANTPRAAAAVETPPPRIPQRAPSSSAVNRQAAAPLIPGRSPRGQTPRDSVHASTAPRTPRTPAEQPDAPQQGSAAGSKAGTPRSQRDIRLPTPRTPMVDPSQERSEAHGPLDASSRATTPNFQTEEDDTISFRPATSTMSPSRKPIIPTQSALGTPRSTIDDGQGNVVHFEPAAVRKTTTADGRVAWMYVDAHRDGTPRPMREIPAPPKALSKRAQDIMAAKRKAVEESAKKRHESSAKIQRHPRQRFSYPTHAYFSMKHLERQLARAQLLNNAEWGTYGYDHLQACQRIFQANLSRDVKWQSEELVRTIQPIQVGPSGSSMCECVVYPATREAQLWAMLSNPTELAEGFKRYLNMQPMQLANVELHDITETPIHSPSSRNMSSANAAGKKETTTTAAASGPRGVATLGGLWCTVEALREDGRPAGRKEVKAPRRVVRICGGQSLGLPLREEDRVIDVRCYELLMFAHESTSPSAVNYGSEGLTLGQLISPPASSFPLTPRLIDDPVALKEYKRKLLATRNRPVMMQNSEDDRATFMENAGAVVHPSRYLTITLVTLNTHQKHTIDLTMVMLPYRERGADGGKILAEIPRFAPHTVVGHRRLHGISLSFSTQSAFTSAYKALLWATECNIVDVTAPTDQGNPYAVLRVSATPSPLMPWSSSMGPVDANAPAHETFHGNCCDFSVLMLSKNPGDEESQSAAASHEPLKLDDFVIEEYKKTEETEDGEDVTNTGSDANTPTAKSKKPSQPKSSIFTSTLIQPGDKKEGDGQQPPLPQEAGSTIVGLTSFGLIRRAVSQRTSQVFDVRVIQRNRAKMCPAFDEETQTIKSAKAEEEHLLQQDVEAAIMMEYVTKLPFQSRVYGVLVDEQRYYIFQEPWISALSLEQATKGSAERLAIEYNPMLKRICEGTSIMSLKDFICAILRSNANGITDREESRLQIAHLLITQFFLLLVSMHGKGVLLGPCPPQRLLVRVESLPAPAEGENQEKQAITSQNIQLFVPDIGINTFAWSYERQQCGVLEYLPPSYVFEHMLGEHIGKESRAWTMRDDWWSFLCICFELLSNDGSGLLKPETEALAVTPTPTITKFFSPLDILNIWKQVLTDESSYSGGTVRDTVAMRVRDYVQQRVLTSIAPLLDGWVASKAEELKYFGTTSPRGKRRGSTRAVSQDLPQSRLLGVSLSSVFLTGRNNTPSSSGIEFEEEGAAENILKEMPWLFHYRQFFDSVIDVVFASDDDALPCAVHGPSLGLVSHPFFTAVNFGEVFDGCHVLPRAASLFFKRNLAKSKLQAALLSYRTKAYSVPSRRHDYPLLITSNAFNAGNSRATLLLLSSPAFQEESMDADYGFYGHEGMVATPAEGVSPSGTRHHRDRSQSARSPRQERIQSIYAPEELQHISTMEHEVRSALQSQGARESVSRREVELPPPGGAMHNDNAHHHRAASTASSHRVASDYQIVRPAVRAPSVDELRSDHGDPLHQRAGTPLAAQHSSASAAHHRDTPRPERVRSARGGGDAKQLAAQRLADFNDMENSLNRQQSSVASPHQPSFTSSNFPRPGPQKGSAASNASGSHNDFLAGATLDGKGAPMKLSDPLITSNRTPSRTTDHADIVGQQQRHNDDDDSSIVLVPSDDDENVDTNNNFYSSGLNNSSPQPRGGDAKATARRESADSRDSYMEF